MYALGVILYEMITGRLPFESSIPLKKRLSELPDPPSKQRAGVDSRWDPIVLGCLQPDPGMRIPSPAAVLRSIETAFAVSHRKRWIAAIAGLAIAVSSGFYYRNTLFPPPPLATLAVMPFTVASSTGDNEVSTIMRGGLSDLAARLGALGAASRRLVIIPPEEVQNYKIDSPVLAAKRLRATHALSGQLEMHGDDQATLHATVTELKTGDVLRQFDAEFRPSDLAGISTSLAGVVTSAFHLSAAPPASVRPEAYAEYAHGLALLRRDLSSYDEAIEQL